MTLKEHRENLKQCRKVLRAFQKVNRTRRVLAAAQQAYWKALAEYARVGNTKNAVLIFRKS